MKRKLTSIFLVFLIIILLTGCAGSLLRESMRMGEARSTSSKLFNLKIGMTNNEVINVMGKPSKTEAYEIQGKNFEFWLYLTEYELTSFATRSEYTPLCFEGDILKGWGRNYYDQALRIKQEIKIEQK